MKSTREEFVDGVEEYIQKNKCKHPYRGFHVGTGHPIPWNGAVISWCIKCGETWAESQEQHAGDEVV